MIIGIDAGGSATKLAAMSADKITFARYIEKGAPLPAPLPEGISRIALTGVNGPNCGAKELGIPITEIPELQAIGRGGTFLAKRDHAIIASIGTGTAFVLAENGKFSHLGGSGIGGGTLMGLGRRVFGTTDAEKLSSMASLGDEYVVDLTIGDLFSGSETLDVGLTASNLAKSSPNATDNDWAAGIVNMVLQAVGTMATLACGGHGVSTVIITGAAARLSSATAAYKKFQDMYGIEFLIPPNAELATAIGAALIAAEGES